MLQKLLKFKVISADYVKLLICKITQKHKQKKYYSCWVRLWFFYYTFKWRFHEFKQTQHTKNQRGVLWYSYDSYFNSHPFLT